MAQTTVAPNRPPTSKQKTSARARSIWSRRAHAAAADMQTLITQLGAAAPNTAITGSAVSSAPRFRR